MHDLLYWRDPREFEPRRQHSLLHFWLDDIMSCCWTEDAKREISFGQDASPSNYNFFTCYHQERHLIFIEKAVL